MIKLIKYCKKYKLRLYMVIVNAVITLIPLIFVGVFTYSVYYNSKIKDISNSVDILFNQVNGRIEQYLLDIDQLTKGIFYNVSLQKFLVKDGNLLTGKPGENQWEYYSVLNDYFNNIMEINNSIKGINLVDLTGRSYNFYSYPLSNDMKSYINNFDMQALKSGKVFFSGTFMEKGEVSDEYLAVKIIKSLRGEGYLDDIAIGVLVLKRNWLDSIIEDNQLMNNSEVLIIDQDNKIISSTNKKNIGNLLNHNLSINDSNKNFVELSGLSYMVKVSPINKAGWKLVAIIPKHDLFKHGNIIKRMIIIIVLVVFPLVTMMTLLFNISITKSIKKLADAFDKLATGDLKSRLSFKNRNEITSIADNFNNMVAEIKTLTTNIFNTQQKLYETELEKKQFELNGLQSQINSHFLYNTLNCIRGMTFAKATEEVVETIDNLVCYFRYNAKNEEYVNLKEEIEHLQVYLSIQSVTFGDKFKIKYEISSGLENYKILKLMLQPLVENAIFHGLKQKYGNGVIKIKAFKKENDLMIQLYDNGIGMDNQTVLMLDKELESNRITTELENRKEDKRESIGIININRRIKVYYGEQYGLRIKSWKGIGTIATLRIPFKEGEQKNV